MSISKRDFLRLGGGAAVALIAAVSPATLNLGGSFPLLAMKRAQAKDGNNGNGGGNGNSSNGGGNSNSGNGGGNGNGGSGNGGGSGSGGGNGNGGGNGGGNGSGNSGNGAGGNSSRDSGSSAAGSSQASGTRATEASDGSIDVRHANGITETLRGGRYIMKDGKGRTIISRQGTISDARRLSQFFR